MNTTKKKSSSLVPAPKRPNLKLNIKDFGPVSSGEIELKPLTVLIGPNNAGKSYTAMLINSIYNSIEQQLPIAPVVSEDDLLRIDKRHKIFDRILALKTNNETILEKKVMDSLSKQLFSNCFEKHLLKEIRGSFLASNNLVNQSKEMSLIGLSSDRFTVNMQYDGHEVKMRNFSGKAFKIKIRKREEPSRQYIFDWEPGGPSYITSDHYLHKDSYGSDPKTTLLGDLFSINRHSLLDSSFLKSFYLPSSRSGLLQIYKLLTSYVYRTLSHIDQNDSDMPRISKVVSDFLAILADLPEGKSIYFRIGEQMEKKILQGKLAVDDSSHLPLPNIEYSHGKLHLPIGGASSTVTELGPIILYLKHVIVDEAIMIVEEPEAHLHPENQRILAQYLVKLIRAGLNIIITTHSDFMLEQLESFIMLGGLDDKTRQKLTRKKYNYDKHDYLHADEVSVNRFYRPKNRKYFNIKKIQVSDKDGIDQEEFVEVARDLYNEAAEIREDWIQFKAKGRE